MAASWARGGQTGAPDVGEMVLARVGFICCDLSRWPAGHV